MIKEPLTNPTEKQHHFSDLSPYSSFKEYLLEISVALFFILVMFHASFFILKHTSSPDTLTQFRSIIQTVHLPLIFMAIIARLSPSLTRLLKQL